METEGTDDSGPHVAGVRQDAADGKHVCPQVMGPPFIQGQAQVPQTLPVTPTLLTSFLPWSRRYWAHMQSCAL